MTDLVSIIRQVHKEAHDTTSPPEDRLARIASIVKKALGETQARRRDEAAYRIGRRLVESGKIVPKQKEPV